MAAQFPHSEDADPACGFTIGLALLDAGTGKLGAALLHLADDLEEALGVYERTFAPPTARRHRPSAGYPRPTHRAAHPKRGRIDRSRRGCAHRRSVSRPRAPPIRARRNRHLCLHSRRTRAHAPHGVLSRGRRPLGRRTCVRRRLPHRAVCTRSSYGPYAPRTLRAHRPANRRHPLTPCRERHDRWTLSLIHI